MTTKRSIRVAAALALTAALAACGGSDKKAADAGATTDKVEVKDFAFNPKSTTVKAGTTVTWTFNDGSTDHTVASKTGESEIPESPKLKDGKTYTHQFSKAGTYAYVCTIHNSMTGTVVVTSA